MGVAHHKPRMTAAEIAKKRSTLFDMLEATARQNKACPGLDTLGRLLSVSPQTVYGMLENLRSERLISWAVKYCGTGLGKVRIVTITSSGLVTATPNYARQATGTRHQQKSDRNELERAKTHLRRHGRVVFDADIADGPASKGLVRVDTRTLKPEAVIALAREVGAN